MTEMHAEREQDRRGPRLNRGFGWLGRFVSWITGWHLEGEEPNCSKFIGVVAPHTSNWDLPIAMMGMFIYRIQANFAVKHTIFWWPLGPILRYLGAIPVERSTHHSMVQQLVAAFKTRDSLVLGIAPEGTRARTECWKSGFYHIAHEAGVPLVLCYIDYKRKHYGCGPTIFLTGDVDADMARVAAFYATVTPRFPELMGPVRIKEQMEAGGDSK